MSAGALALMLQNIFTVICSFAVPLLQRKVPALTVQRVYTLALACMSLLLFCVSMLSGGSVGATTVFVCLMGLAQYGSQTFPYALMGMAVPDGEKGLFMGVLTLAIVIPQLLDVTYSGSLASGAGVEWVVFAGAVWAALAAGATVFLPSSEALRRRAGGAKGSSAGDDAGLFTQLEEDDGV